MNNPRNQPLRILPIPRSHHTQHPFDRLVLHVQRAHGLAKIGTLVLANGTIGSLFFTEAIHARFLVGFLIGQCVGCREELMYVGRGFGRAGCEGWFEKTGGGWWFFVYRGQEGKFFFGVGHQ